MQFALRAARTSRGYTIREVAELCGVSIKTISKYENDSRKLPLYLALQLSDLYEIPPNAIIGHT